MSRSVFLYIHRAYVERCLLGGACRIVAGLQKVFAIFAPSGIHQVERSETQNDRLLELAQEHSHEPDRLKPAYAAHLAIRLPYGNTELIPFARRHLTVRQFHVVGLLNIHYMVLAYHHPLRTQVDNVLVVVFGLREGVVAVYVLHIGVERPRGAVALLAVAVHRRVALWVVEVFVAVVDLHILFVVIGAAEIAVVVARRIGHRSLVGTAPLAVARGYALQVFRKECLLVVQPVCRAQSVVAHILILASRLVVVECVHHRLQFRHPSPYGGVDIHHRRARRQAVLKALPPVAQYVLAYIAQIDIQLAARVRGVLYKRVHQPKLDGLYVLRLKVGIVHLAHDAAPPACRVHQVAVGIHSRTVRRGTHVVIVGSLLRGIVCQIDLIEVVACARGQVFVGEYLLLGYAPRIRTRQVVDGDVRRPSGGMVKLVADAIPRQAGPVVAIGQSSPRRRFGKHRHGQHIVLRRAGQKPTHRRGQVDTALRPLEVVDIAHAPFLRPRRTHARYEVGKLGR